MSERSTAVQPRRFLLTGATGYVGGRLLKSLEASRCHVRCLARRPEFLRARVGPGTEVVQGDVLDTHSLVAAMSGIQTAYYLVHSMGSGGSFEEQDRIAASNFGQAARQAGVTRIIYLGGLGEAEKSLSEHLRSRQEVGEILRQSGVPVIEFRASVIIGSGSVSFEMVRALVDRLPVMICPRWVRTPTQPIAIEDVIQYLVQAADLPLERGSEIFEIGGADVVSYRDLMQAYGNERGLKRWLISVPVLTPWLSSLWLGLVTPVYARVGRKLIEGLRNPTVVRDNRALRVFNIKPRGVQEAVARALANEEHEFAETRWSDATSSAGARKSWGGARLGSRIVDLQTAETKLSPAEVFAPIRRIGGKNGWYFANSLWRIRGFVDLLVGGVGLRRGRRDPEHPAVGDALDFWRVEAYEPDRRLRLLAEMKVPGRAWLEFEVEPADSGSVVRQTAVFQPAGLSGLAYWYLLYPVHAWIFRGMLRQIVKRAELGKAREDKHGPL
ncbi:MAG: SDR family oxidoreductase [Acidobacteriota bacterium]